MPALLHSDVAPPRLLRAAGMQALALIALALAAELWARTSPKLARDEPEKRPPRAEKKLRVITLPKKPPPPIKVARAEPKPPAQQKQPPRPRAEKPQPIKQSRAQPAPAHAESKPSPPQRVHI